jgi:predicted nucleotidyltransferase component of viral defense system
MYNNIRKSQKKALKIFSKHAKNFALSGGTALELYYLHHRFSVDLDFFSTKFDAKEIDTLIREFEKYFNVSIKQESEITAAGKAKVRFYSLPLKEADRPLKIDFIEDTIFDNPDIKDLNGIRVYSAENIYLQKIAAITGTSFKVDYLGREIMQGRLEARDVFDVYMLSKKIRPLHLFLKKVPMHIQRGMVQWYRKFSRTEIKLALLELDIYESKFNSKEMIIYLEKEIEKFVQETVQ